MTSQRVPDKKKRWVASVKTDSTHPPEGLFTKSATTISRVLASKKVSPKGQGPACECSLTSSTGRAEGSPPSDGQS
jgi:hypothetical protein